MKGCARLAICLLAITSSCGLARQTIGDGAIQKRKLRPGWHVDLGLRQPQQPTAQRIIPVRSAHSAPAPSNLEPELLAGAGDAPLAPPPQPAPGPIRHDRAVPVQLASVRTAALPPHATPLIVDPPARWNPWAVPAFLLALGTVAYAILGTSELLVVIAVIATLVLASIAVRKGRMNEWSGKGFAIAALMIGALAGLITLIALLAG